MPLAEKLFKGKHVGYVDSTSPGFSVGAGRGTAEDPKVALIAKIWDAEEGLANLAILDEKGYWHQTTSCLPHDPTGSSGGWVFLRKD